MKPDHSTNANRLGGNWKYEGPSDIMDEINRAIGFGLNLLKGIGEGLK